jgi:hypothetical protein
MRYVLVLLVFFCANMVLAQNSYSARDGSLGGTTWVLNPHHWYKPNTSEGMHTVDKNFLRSGVHFPYSQLDPILGYIEYTHLKRKTSYSIGLSHVRLASAKFSTSVSVCFSGLVGEHFSFTLLGERLQYYTLQSRASNLNIIQAIATYQLSEHFRIALRLEQRIQKIDTRRHLLEPLSLWVGASQGIGRNVSMSWTIGKANGRAYEIETGLEISQFQNENLTLRFGCQGFDPFSSGIGLGWRMGNIDFAATVKLHPKLGHDTLSDVTYGW